MNPQHCVPTLNDNGFILWESRAILGYLVDQYAKDDSLYPKDPKKRAVVDQRLYFDLGTLYPKYTEFYRPRFFTDDGPNPEHVAAFGEPIALLEKFLEGKEWVAGDQITIADYVLVTTISHMEGPICQSILMLAQTLDIKLDLKKTNSLQGETKTPEFLKMNPQHCIQTINDNGFYLWESRAILGYLVDQYAKDDSLYPKDAKKRAVVNQRLYFDMGSLAPKFSEFYVPVLIGGKSPNPEHIAAFGQPIELLEKFLEGQEWVAGNHITIADYAIVTTISIMEGNGYDMSKHPNVNRWLTKAKQEIPSYKDIVPPGIAIVRNMLKTGLK